MITIIGRIAADAQVKTVSEGRQVVTFTIAQNERFRVKDSNEVKQVVTYFNCSYWLKTTIASHLQKGVLVEVSGRVGVNAWKDAKGEPRASLTLHVQNIQLHGKAGKGETTPAPQDQPADSLDEVDDLPF
ncbi:single-stranded DNA-binding protein [Niabella sp. 22666]|uniref:single-stranded DNA-binding protein n=1 Tax=Niabella sp. 22666 TaxID=3453954 RepID=UPI003F874280